MRHFDCIHVDPCGSFCDRCTAALPEQSASFVLGLLLAALETTNVTICMGHLIELLSGVRPTLLCERYGEATCTTIFEVGISCLHTSGARLSKPHWHAIIMEAIERG